MSEGLAKPFEELSTEELVRADNMFTLAHDSYVSMLTEYTKFVVASGGQLQHPLMLTPEIVSFLHSLDIDVLRIFLIVAMNLQEQLQRHIVMLQAEDR